MPRLRLAALVPVALVLAACSGGSSPATSQPPATIGPDGATRIEVDLTDSLRIEPAEMTVPAGVPVTFVVTNSGALEHEFYVGDEAAQEEHDREMLSGGMAHDEPNGIGVDPGQTKELTITFDADGPPMLAGCHVQGHWLAGMKATITVEAN